ncbi:MAG TPA: HD domain-containing phosphohydrolase [Vicinamibacterales bacterium]|nr:HD domain-containing phosphohydrolase [Vicinamibacterales bacterium]
MAPRTPRFVVRTMATTFATVVFILGAVLLVVTLTVRERMRTTVIEHLSTQQGVLRTLEQRRLAEMQSQAQMLAESPTVKAAMDTYHSEARMADGDGRTQLLVTVSRELEELASRIRPDIIAVTDPAGLVIAASGRRRADWPRELPNSAAAEFVTTPGGIFRVAAAPFVVQQTLVGYLQLGSALDGDYAAQITSLSGTGTLIAANGAVVASTLPPRATRALTPPVLAAMPDADIVDLDGEQYAVRTLLRHGDLAVYTMDSIEASARAILGTTVRALGIIALCSLALAAIASMWLARTLARPIDTLSRSLTALASSRDFDRPVARTGSSVEVDALTDTFNSLMSTVAAAEEETRSTYVGAIRALALALDARDPYTAGHSERVSTISVTVGHHMGLGEDDLDTLRLGALLHDIGKIGISDDVLRKAGPLTAVEYEAIKQHPVTGARILRSVAFLARHLPIVELHHERPDGKGYPYGRLADEIPVLARIVHVVDAFDAMTSARAYRPARSAAEALQELWRHAGSQFDADVVQALAAVAPTLRLEQERHDVAHAHAPRSTLVTFPRA